MKITFEVPDKTVAMVVTGICENRLSYNMATTQGCCRCMDAITTCL